jgi:hypothetical protein
MTLKVTEKYEECNVLGLRRRCAAANGESELRLPPRAEILLWLSWVLTKSGGQPLFSFLLRTYGKPKKACFGSGIV